MSTRQALALQALRKSIEVRKDARLGLDEPVNPVDLAVRLGVSVRFVEVSMEGMYAGGRKPQILLSSLRPLARRFFTCGHELGHHVFGHGSTIDEIQEMRGRRQFQPEEFLVDSFAGALLMPPLGIEDAFRRRGINLDVVSAVEIHRVACSFGVGFETLLVQLRLHSLISESASKALTKTGLAGVRRTVTGNADAGILYQVDREFEANTLDLEVGARFVLPSDVSLGGRFTLQSSCATGNVWLATAPGIDRVCAQDRAWSIFLRTSRLAYVGLAQYRHMEEAND